jgi:hypothetical protein
MRSGTFLFVEASFILLDVLKDLANRKIYKIRYKGMLFEAKMLQIVNIPEG